MNCSRQVTKYDSLGASVSAMRKDNGVTSTLYWVLGDHLGSVSIILDASGNSLNPLQNVKYLPWGGLRTGSVQLTLSMKGYTGQYREDLLY